MRWAGAIFLCCLLWSCSSVRKISQWERRDPASSMPTEGGESSLRQKLAEGQGFDLSCAKEWPELKLVFSDRVVVPGCPDSFVALVQSTGPLFSLENRSRLEEYLRSQCTSNSRDLQEALQGMLLAHSSASSSVLQNERSPEERKSLDDLFSSLRQTIATRFPLDRWQMSNGPFFVPEGDLPLYEKILRSGCRIEDQALDPIYQSIHAMEDLERSLENGEQKTRLRAFLNLLQKMVDKKVEDFFR